MNKLVRYIIIGFIVALVAFLVWVFSSIVAYILISAVLSLMGKPIVDLISKIKIKKWSPPQFIGAIIALLTLWYSLLHFSGYMIHPGSFTFNELGTIDVQALVAKFAEPINSFQLFSQKYLPKVHKDLYCKIFL
jgi:predicted PurR-regulated permease PerM